MHKNQATVNVISCFVTFQHVDGKINLADIFMKDMKDTAHFVELHDLFMCPQSVI